MELLKAILAAECWAIDLNAPDALAKARKYRGHMDLAVGKRGPGLRRTILIRDQIAGLVSYLEAQHASVGAPDPGARPRAGI